MAAPTVGTKNDNQVSAGSSLSITLTNAPSAGGIVVVLATYYTGNGSSKMAVAATGGTGVTITERVETAGNVNDAIGCGIWTVEYTTAPTSLAVSRTSGSNLYATASCVNVSGQTASYFDVAGPGSGTGTSASASSMADLTDATDLVLGVMTRLGTSGTIAPATDWTQIVEIDEGNVTYQTLNAIQRTPGATGAYDPAWTLSTSDTWAAAGIAIKGTSGGGGSTELPFLTMAPLSPPRWRQ